MAIFTVNYFNLNSLATSAEWNFVEFGLLLLILCWEGLFSVFANFRGEISLFLISKVFSLLDAVIIFSKSSGDIYQNLLEFRGPLIYLTLPWYSSFIHPYKAKKHMFPDFSSHKVATGINSLWLRTFWMFTIGKCFLSSIVVQVILYFPIDLCVYLSGISYLGLKTFEGEGRAWEWRKEFGPQCNIIATLFVGGKRRKSGSWRHSSRRILVKVGLSF